MTTTKTGIDSDHPVFKSIRSEMLTAMKQVINFLSKIEDKEERDDFVNNSSKIRITEVREKERNYSAKFIYPNTKSSMKTNSNVTISYSKDRATVDKLKEFLGVATNREIGEKTFDYFVNMNKAEL